MDTFVKIDYKLLEILALIEHSPDFPILAKDIKHYINSSKEHTKIYEIYEKIAYLRENL